MAESRHGCLDDATILGIHRGLWLGLGSVVGGVQFQVQFKVEFRTGLGFFSLNPLTFFAALESSTRKVIWSFFIPYFRRPV